MHPIYEESVYANAYQKMVIESNEGQGSVIDDSEYLRSVKTAKIEKLEQSIFSSVAEKMGGALTPNARVAVDTIIKYKDDIPFRDAQIDYLESTLTRIEGASNVIDELKSMYKTEDK